MITFKIKLVKMFDISDPLNINDHEKHSLVVIELFERTN